MKLSWELVSSRKGESVKDRCLSDAFLLIQKHFLLFHFQVEEEPQMAEEKSGEEVTKVRMRTCRS